MSIKKDKIVVVLVPRRKEHDDPGVHLPYIQAIPGLLYFVDPAVLDSQGLIPENLIPSLQEEIVGLIDRQCAIDAESACLYFVADDGTVYEVDMISPGQRFLLVLLPSGEYGDLLYVMGAIFCPEVFCSGEEGVS